MAELVVNQRAAVDIHLDIERSMIKQIGNMHVTASCLRLMADAQVNAAMRQDAIASNATMTEIRTRTNGTTYTVQVPDEAARAVARQSAAAHRALAQALRLKARAIGNAVVSLQIAMAQVKKDFNRIIDESIRIDRYHSERLNEIRGWMRSFTNRMHEIRNGINLQHPINAGEFAPTSMGVRKNTMLSFLEGCALAGMPHFTVFALDPVNTATGNFIYSKTDMSVGGRYPLEFTRFYNSIGGMENDVLGVNWTHNHNIRLYSQDEAVRIIYGDGHMETHGQLDDGGYLSPLENSNTLLLHTDEGFKLWTNDNVIYEFDKEGFLQTQSDINGNETKYEHTDGLLIKVSNPCGSMTFEYEDRQITKVTDHTGREVKLSYNGKMLGKVTHPSGAEYSYEYDSYGNLEKVTNPLGIEAISNEYDGHGRLTRQSFPDGGVATLRYDDKITTMTEQSGNVVKYERDDKYRTVKTIHSDSEEHFGYNEYSKRTMYKDRNGNVRKFEYDVLGNVTKAIDPLGNSTVMEYGRYSKLTKVIAPNGGVISNEYDDNGNLLSVINPLGFAVKLTNDMQGQVTEVKLPDGSTSCLSYDERGNISTVTDALGNATKYEYDNLNQAVKAIDPMGNATQFEYNTKGDISKATNAEGKSQSYEYDKSGKLIKLTDFGGGVAQYQYNSVGKLEEVTDPSGGVTKLDYDLMWNVTKVTKPCGNSVQYEYDLNQRVIRTIDEEGNATSYEHDFNGNVTAAILPNGARASIKYDALDRQHEITEPDGAVTKLEYDSMGSVTKITDPQGGEILREYDIAGQLISVTDQMGNSTKYAYTNLGQIATVTDALGGVTKYAYYPGGKVKSVTRPGGEVESYAYDKNGNVTEITDVLGSTAKVSYDCLDRINEITNALGHSKQFSYDALGNITSITDESGNTTNYKYDSLANLVEVIDALGHSTKYDYDKSGEMTRIEQYRIVDETISDIKQIELQVTTWERNKRGEVIKKSTPLGGETHYKYDSLGNLVSQIDEEGSETLYEYNLASKLTKVAYADGKTVELGYNPLRQLTELKDWLGTTTIELDPLGRATKVTDHDDNVVEYAYDALSRRESINYPDKSTVNYSYDISGRITGVTSETGTTKYSYSISDRLLERIMPDNIVTQQRTDQLGRLESLTHKQNDKILDSFKYNYDPVGNITQIEKHRTGVEADSGVFSYSYDKLGRLNEAANGQNSKQYIYDSLGNRTMSVYNGIETKHSYNVRNQLIKTTEPDLTKEYNYDARGNLTQILESGTTTSTFTFNSANRMTQAITPKGKAEYEYNGFLKRVSKLEELRGGDCPQSPDVAVSSELKYTLDLTKPYNDLLAIGEQRFIWGNELLQSEGSNEFSYLADHLGSPIRLVGTENNEALAYDEFGVPTVEATASTLHNPFGFTGYQHDSISGLQYAQARYYAPTLGRFGAEDVIRWGVNWYIYADNSPLKFIDPCGLAPGNIYQTEQEALESMYYHFFGVTDYSEFEFSSALYRIERRIPRVGLRTVGYSYTDIVMGEPHMATGILETINLVPEANRGRLHTIVGFAHSHPNSNQFSDADRSWVNATQNTLYALTPNGSILRMRYGDEMETLISSGNTFSQLSAAKKAFLRDRYGPKMIRHILEGNCLWTHHNINHANFRPSQAMQDYLSLSSFTQDANKHKKITCS